MITFRNLGVPAYGRIGNQLFQYAVTRLIAEKCGYSYGVPDWLGRTYFEDLERDLYPPEEEDRIGKGWNEFNESPFRGYRPFSHPCIEALWRVRDKTDLRGFFQSYKYYDHGHEKNRGRYRDKVRRWYTLKEKYQQKVSDLVAQIGGPFIGLQFRRADEYAQTFPIIGDSYYKDALQYLGSRVDLDSYRYVVSSDVPCETLNLDFLPKDKIHFAQGEPIIVMFVMAQSTSFIMANSSFSWWTAFLNTGERPVIIAPKNYSGIDFCYPHDIYPPDWVKLPVTDYINKGGWYIDRQHGIFH